MADPLTRLKQSADHLLSRAAVFVDMAESKKSNITLYTDSTPNGIKISIALEELGLVSSKLHPMTVLIFQVVGFYSGDDSITLS